MRRFLNRAMFASATAAFGVGCGPGHLFVGAAPALPQFDSSPPDPPEAKSHQPVPFTVDARKTAAREPPDLRSRTLAVSVEVPGSAGQGPGWSALALALASSGAAAPALAGEDGAKPVDETSRLFDGLVPESLLARGYTRVIYPASTRRILGRVQRERVVDKATREVASLVGSLDRLAEVGGAVPADYLLSLDVTRAEPTKLSVPVTFGFAPGVLTAYEREVGALHAALKDYKSEVYPRVKAYRDEYQAARRQYERAGGKYEDPESSEARTEFASWDAQATALLARIAGIRMPTPDELIAKLKDRATEEPVEAGRVALRARLVDLKSGETFWLLEVEATQADVAAAARKALDETLARLSGGAPSRERQESGRAEPAPQSAPAATSGEAAPAVPEAAQTPAPPPATSRKPLRARPR